MVLVLGLAITCLCLKTCTNFKLFRHSLVCILVKASQSSNATGSHSCTF